mmetsp:Transcript_22213/g.32439  ORF Transcript_22213/g.32439 Transcript_22213/m.32439 type:complete len:242 (+) Transcript_22213:29-754(+)
MGFGLTPAVVAEFASRPYIAAALQSPFRPQSVLTFFLGFDVQSPDAGKMLKDGSYVKTMEPFWFSGNTDFDKLCRTFTPLVREAGDKSLKTREDADWESVHGKISQLILLDQLSRNCFRGTEEAFMYDDASVELANELAAIALSDNPDFCGSYTIFLALAFMHSEVLDDHRTGIKCLEKAKETCPTVDWDFTKGFLTQHTKVIEQFGRYPHRNTKMGRTTTKKEEEWLNSPDVPMWAKSQG